MQQVVDVDSSGYVPQGSSPIEYLLDRWYGATFELVYGARDEATCIAMRQRVKDQIRAHVLGVFAAIAIKKQKEIH